MKKYAVKENLIQAILKYMYSKPYGEVQALIKELVSIEEILEETKEEKKDKK
tara:strand:+ start:201 stop:356 length:156 start_codon:yes stop_codon:yes gene_type:complete